MTGSGRPIRRRLFLGETESSLSLSLLPLLDVLTSTIGVFLTIMTFQVYGISLSSGTKSPDVLIIIEPEDEFLVIKNGEGILNKFYSYQLKGELHEFGKKLERPINILVAVAGKELLEKEKFQRALDTWAQRDRSRTKTQDTMTIAAGHEGISFTLAWMPLDSTGAVRSKLLQTWTVSSKN
jgi:hypothetical protein